MDWANISYYTIWIYCSCQILLISWAYIRYLVPLSRRFRNVKKAINIALSLRDAENPPQIKRKEAEESLFGDVVWAREYFRAYVAAWRDARIHGEDRAACSVLLSDFLTPQIVIQAASNQRAADAFPGFLLAGGIFGTFLGIVMALAGVNLTSPDTNEAIVAMNAGVRAIVSGMKLAFFTSLIGIFSSVAFSWRHRGLLRRLEASMHELDAIVRDFFPCLSEEYYERQYLENVIGIKAQMQTLATDIALSISNQMGAVMETSVTNQLSPFLIDIKNVMDRFVRDMDVKNADAVDKMLNKYVDMLSITFAEQMESITAMIKNTGEAQDNIREVLVQYVENLKKQCVAHEDLMERTTHTIKYLDESLEDLSECAAYIKESATDLRKTADLFSQTANSLDGIKDLHQNLESLIEALTNNVKNLLTHVDGLLTQMAEALGGQLTAALNSFDDKIAEVLRRFSGTLAETRDTINELPSLLGDLSGSIDKIATTLDSRQEEITKLMQSSEALLLVNSNNIKEAATNTATVTAGIQSVVVSLETWLTRFEDVVKVAINSDIQKDARPTGTDLPDSDGNNESALVLKGVINSLEKPVEQLATEITQLRRGILEIPLDEISATQVQLLDTSGEIRAILRNIEAATGNMVKGMTDLREQEPAKKGLFGGIFSK